MRSALFCLNSQEGAVLITAGDVFPAIVNVHILQRIEPFVALELINVVVVIDVELIAPQHRHRRHLIKGQQQSLQPLTAIVGSSALGTPASRTAGLVNIVTAASKMS